MKKFVFGMTLVMAALLLQPMVSRAASTYPCSCPNGDQFFTEDAADCTRQCAARGAQGANSNNPSRGATSNNPSAQTVNLPNPLGNDEGSKDIRVIIGRIIRVLLGLVGSLALVMVIYGGLLWMTSAGNADRLTQGRNTLIWATLGMVVIFTSYLVVGFIIESIAQRGG